MLYKICALSSFLSGACYNVQPMRRLLLFIFSIEVYAGLVPCHDFKTTDKDIYLCDQQQQLVRETHHYANNYVEFLYQNGKLSSYYFYNQHGILLSYSDYQWQVDGSILKSSFKKIEQDYVLFEKYQYLFENNNPKRPTFVIRQWIFDEKYQIKAIDWYSPRFLNRKFVITRETLNQDGQLLETHVFDYNWNHPDPLHPVSFVRYDSLGQVTGEYFPLDFDNQLLLDELGVTENCNKTLIGVIDTDFDLNHFLLRPKIWLEPAEPLDGIDNDGNGRIDDFVGWNGYTNTNNVLSPVVLYDNEAPLSHGTHVASIALEDRDDTRFVAFAGDFTRPEHLNYIEATINMREIKFTNMSFSFGDGNNPFGADMASVKAMQSLIENTPNTLHLIAAGNDSHCLDGEQNRLVTYPASSPSDNTLVIGAITTDALNDEMYDEYELTWFSNYGAESVDILSPGQKVNGARLGGGMIRFSGTSMATPYALNHIVLAVNAANSELTPLQIKEIVMKTAYIRDLNNPFPVRSGGIIVPARAVRVAELLKKQKGLSITQAVLRQRLPLLPGETLATEDELMEFWSKRDI